MVGKNNSVWSRLKQAAPDCELFKCICHSLALCIQHAVEKLPSNICFLLSEIPNWFKNSDVRRERYKELYAVFNATADPELARVTPHPFEKTSTTRWLICGKVMYNLLVN